MPYSTAPKPTVEDLEQELKRYVDDDLTLDPLVSASEKRQREGTDLVSVTMNMMKS